MKQKELKFDIEKINDMKKSLSDSADDLNTYKDKVIQSLLKRVNGNKFERLDNMYIEAEEYNKNVQLKIGQRIQENRE